MSQNKRIDLSDDTDTALDVLIICALKVEFDQVLEVTQGIQSPGWENKYIGPNGWSVADCKFITSTGDLLSVRATWAGTMGREQAQATVSTVIQVRPARCIAMCGICAGRRGKVNLGDVIFADRLWSYDSGKFSSENGGQEFRGDMHQYKTSQVWLQRMQQLKPPLNAAWLELRPSLPLEYQESWVLLRLVLGNAPTEHRDFSTECPNWTQVISRLRKRKWVDMCTENEQLELTLSGRKRANELKLTYLEDLPIPDKFKIHVAPIATGSGVIEDDEIFTHLSRSMRKVLGIDMEASAIAALGENQDIPVLVAKGVSDFGDSFKDDRYHQFAARAAAECLISLLREATDLLPPKSDMTFNKVANQTGWFEDGVLADHHGSDAMQGLQSILKRRFSPSQDTLGQLHQLASDLEADGKFRAAPISIKINVHDWIARIAAGGDLLQEAEEALAAISALGSTASPIAHAWRDVALGNTDIAIQNLREIDDPESRSNIFAILRKEKGNEAALDYLDTLEPWQFGQFSEMGWKNIVGCLAEKERIDDALRALTLIPIGSFSDYPVLSYIRGVVYATYLVPEDYREWILTEDFLAVSEHLLEGTDTDNWRQQATDAFSLSRDAARKMNDSELEGATMGWLRWLRILDPVSNQEELTSLTEDMCDGRKAVECIPFAVTFNLKFDSTSLEHHLAHSEALGGLTAKELNAKILLLRHLRRFQELAHFIEENWKQLLKVNSTAGLGGGLIEAYINAGECGEAERVLVDKERELHNLDVPRFRLMIADCRGEDPIQDAKTNYESTGAIGDLWNLVRGLEVGQRWSELTPYAHALFERESNTETALCYVQCLQQTKASEKEVTNFLDQNPELVDLNADLKSAKAWALYHLGKVEDARLLNDQLLRIRQNANDLGLDINLAVRLGSWEKFIDIIARIWGQRYELPAPMLLHLAKLAGSSVENRAIQLSKEVVERYPNDPDILFQAHGVASALARDDIAMPWLHRAIQLSKETANGLVNSYSYRETIEIMKDHADDWQRNNELFRKGQIPMHLAAVMIKTPLSRFLIAIPRDNIQQADARKRYPVPVRSGARQPLNTTPVRKLVLDVTSIFVLSELNILHRVFNIMDEILLSPRTMEILLDEREKVAFHQPSRIADAKPLLNLIDASQITLVQEVGDDSITSEVGEEMAVLLWAAKQSNGLCIHSGKVYRAGSYMDEEANLGDFSSCIASPIAVANALLDEGRITSARHKEAITFLKQVSGEDTADNELSPNASIFLDTLSAQYLSKTSLLADLIRSQHNIFVHSSAAEEWRTLVASEPYTETIIKAIESIRNTLGKGITDRKVKFIPEARNAEKDEHFELVTMPVIDLLEDMPNADAVCIDDRFLNAKALWKYRTGRRVPLLTSTDVIDMLVERGEITVAKRLELGHEMRERCLFAMPIEADYLEGLLNDAGENEIGELRESAELRVIREYLSRLHSADVLCTEPDHEYLNILWRTGLEVVHSLWANESTSIEAVEVRSDWVVDYVIPDIELAFRFSPQCEDQMEQIASARLMSFLLHVRLSQGRSEKYAVWLERKITSSNLPANSSLIDRVTDDLSRFIITHSKEVVDELGK